MAFTVRRAIQCNTAVYLSIFHLLFDISGYLSISRDKAVPEDNALAFELQFTIDAKESSTRDARPKHLCMTYAKDVKLKARFCNV